MAEYHFALLCSFIYAFTQITVMNLPYGGEKNASTCLVLYVFISNVAHTTNLSLVLQLSHSDLFLTIKLPLTQTIQCSCAAACQLIPAVIQ